MKHYNFKEIKEHGDCVRFVTEVLGIPVENGRCVAVWRDGERDSVTIEREQYYDHATQTGGGIIDLCAVSKFGGTDASAIQKAQEFLGDWLHLEEVKLRKAPSSKANRYDDLIAAGYKEVKRYEYRDLEGKLVHFVCRMEHPVEHKEFVQGTPNHWGLGDVTPILYNLSAIAKNPWCIIVEGEKDVDTLSAIGVPATTNAGGAKKWNHAYSEYFKGKEVIILPDNDDVGQEHGRRVASDLFGIAGGIKIVTCSRLPKGDVTDYFTKEGGTWESLSAMIAGAPAYEKIELNPVEAAKEANKKDFNNFIMEETEIGKRKIQKKIPRQINELVADLHVRLLGAPYRVGEQLFDQDRETNEVNYIYDPAGLFSWIGRKTKKTVEWAKTDGCVTKAEFYEALRAEATSYSAISMVPDYPARSDVYYAHPDLPKPSENHSAFWNFIDFFSPVDSVNRTLIAAFVMSPIFYISKVDKPLWIIDSPDGQGSGKSTIPFLTAQLYGYQGIGGEVIDVTMYDLEKNYMEVVKRLISPAGRNNRIFLLDNVKGMLRSANLAKLVTTSSISGRASYGRGEESRPNNLTYVVTINSATVDTDIASRAFYIMVKKPTRSANWKINVCAHIEKYRMNIFADIIDIISGHQPYGIDPITRTPEFETRVLQAVCGSPEHYQTVMEFLISKKEETNSDEETARRIEEEIFQRMINVKPIMGRNSINPKTDRIFIRSNVIEEWFKGKSWIDRQPVSIINNLARTGMLPQVSPKVTKWPHHADKLKRRNGILWNPGGTDEQTRVIGMLNDKDAIEVESD